MRLAYPGIGGSLGECVLCGESFAVECCTGRSIPMIGIEGFDRDLPIHQRCMEKMKDLRGQSWEMLPDGPLRKEYEEVFSQAVQA